MNRRSRALNQLLEKLGDEIKNAVRGNKEVDRICKAIHAEGYETNVFLESKIVLDPTQPASIPADDHGQGLLNSIRDLDPDQNPAPPE
jgi:hypothetical protein